MIVLLDDNSTKKLKSHFNQLCRYLLATVKSTFNPFLRFPILIWIRKYKLSFIQRDLIAGITVGLTLIPQGLSYGQQAGLPAYYGLYSSFVSPIVYCFLGGSKDITNGPTAIMSTLVSDFAKAPSNAAVCVDYTDSECQEETIYAGGTSPAEATLLAFWTGIILFGIAFLQLGWIKNYISHIIIVAFIQANAITIPVGQLHKWFGISSTGCFPKMSYFGVKHSHLRSFWV